MHRVVTAVTFVVLCALMLAGCSKLIEKQQAPTPPPPPPPSPAQIADEIRICIDPVKVLPPGLPIPPDIQAQALNGLRTMKAKHQSTENGKIALSTITGEMKDALTTAQQMKEWQKVVFWCDALDILDPGDPRYKTAKEKALIQINRPQVTVRGFFEDVQTGMVQVFLEVYLPETGESRSERVREGQEFCGLKLINIIGKNKGVRLEYIRAQETFDVLGPTPRAPQIPAVPGQPVVAPAPVAAAPQPAQPRRGVAVGVPPAPPDKEEE